MVVWPATARVSGWVVRIRRAEIRARSEEGRRWGHWWMQAAWNCEEAGGGEYSDVGGGGFVGVVFGWWDAGGGGGGVEVGKGGKSASWGGSVGNCWLRLPGCFARVRLLAGGFCGGCLGRGCARVEMAVEK